MNISIKYITAILKALLLSLGLYMFVINLVNANDFLDRLMDRCSKGDSLACNEIEMLMEKHKKQIDSINAQADAFQAESSSLVIENNKIPNIIKSYPIILERYMSSKTVEPVHRTRGLNPDLIKVCSSHLHDLYFVHNKEIPSLESGYPDWAVIYLVTIDHYFRYCSKSIQNN